MAPVRVTTDNEDDEFITENFKWDFYSMQPKEAFCNWKIKVKNYLPDSGATDSYLVGNKVQVTLRSLTDTPFALVSEANRNFDFAVN